MLLFKYLRGLLLFKRCFIVKTFVTVFIVGFLSVCCAFSQKTFSFAGIFDDEDWEGSYRLSSGILGIDVSCWNTPNDGHADFSRALRDGYKFAIIRASLAYETSKCFDRDSYFFRQVEAARNACMPMGAYHYGQFENLEQVREQAVKFCDTVDEARHIFGVKFDFPLYLDIENPIDDDIFDRLHSQGKLGELVWNFCDIIRQRGYLPGIYCSSRNFRTWFFDVSQQPLDRNNRFYAKAQRWLAWWPSGSYDIYGDEAIRPPWANMWQYTSQAPATGYGATKNCTRVDANLCYLDYPRIMRDNRLGGY
ncbi:MAG: hypothetical protein LBF33_02650 [Oscillospiraceae bacterium]|jgi:GH25 family lysozyme M1 (1,4-beta-N-acetylmuramidase)|nr:hypothetical protein [Oscillospiraceae bacterium]